MTNKLFFSTLLIVFPLFLFAKPAGITGKIKNDQGNSLAAVNVVVLKADNNSLVKADLTNDNGIYSIDDIEAGVYIVKATLLGYEPASSEKVEISTTSITIPDLIMKPKAGTLKEVSVRAQKPFIEVQADKIVVNVENSIVSAGSSALEVLGRSPGVRIDQNDNISLKGKQGVTIMIDGKITPASGQDLASMLKSMPSNFIDKIELISNPGAKYDAAGTAGIINIRTKKDQRMGWNGTVNASYVQGVYPKVNAGINLNYRNRKLNMYVNASYASRYWFNHLMLNRRFYDTSSGDYSKKLFTYDQDNYAVMAYNTPIASAGVDYNISKRTVIGAVVSGSNTWVNPKADNNSRALDQQDRVMYYFHTTGRHKNVFYSYSTNLNLRHDIDTNGRQLSVDADYAAYSSQSNQNFITTYTSPDGKPYLPDYFLKSDLTGATQIRSLKADYTHPLKDNAGFDAGIKSSYTTSDKEPLFYEKIAGGVYALNTKMSNHFIYKENINAAYLNAKKDWTKWSTQLGLRVENTNANGEQIVTGQTFSRNYTQFFPSIAVQRHVDPKNDVGVTLSRRVERPRYDQLDPFKYFIDKTTYKVGYPYLQPALSYNVELSHTYNQRFITTFTYNVTDNVITQVIQPSDDEDSVTVQTDKNLTRMIFYGVSGSYSPQFTKWWSNVTNFNVYYARYEGNVANTSLSNGKPTFDIYTNNTFILPWDMSAELGLFYQARMLYAYMDLIPTWMLNAGIQKNFLNKKLTLRLNAQDIFWHGYPGATSSYLGYQEDFIAKRDTRQFTIAVTYRFGKKSVAPVRRRTGGAEDEKRRANTGGA